MLPGHGVSELPVKVQRTEWGGWGWKMSIYLHLEIDLYFILYSLKQVPLAPGRIEAIPMAHW